MAIQHLIENFRPDISTFQSQVNRRKITESELKTLSAINPMRLSESVKKYLEQHPVATLEGKDVYRFPISRYDWKNDNGRVYEKRLWQRVIDEQKEAYQGNVGLADHPSDEGKFKEAAIVWLNMGLDESNRIVWGEGILVGGNGGLAEEIMEAGGRVGFSSSGFGELNEADKSTVLWDSYQLERPADIVLNPSQKVYGTSGMKMSKHESIEKDALNEKANPGKCKKCKGDAKNLVDDLCIECRTERMKKRQNDEEHKDDFNENNEHPYNEEDTPHCTNCDKVMEWDVLLRYKAGKPFCSDKCKNEYETLKDRKKENTPMASSETKLSKLEERKFRRDVGVFLEEADKLTDPKEKLEQLTEIAAYFSEGMAPDLKGQVDKKIAESNVAIEKAIKEHGKLIETFGVDNIEAMKEGVKKIAVDTQLFERDATEWKEIATGLQEKVQKLNAVINTRPTVEAYKTALAFSSRMKEVFKNKEEELLHVIEDLQSTVKKHKLIEQKMISELAKSAKVVEGMQVKNQKLHEYATKVRGIALEYRARDEESAQYLKEANAEKDRIHITPQRTRSSMFDGFNESKEIQSYYLDLVRRYGETIEPYKEDILGCKTLKEAMKIWVDIMAEVSSPQTHKVTEALEPEERRRIIEGQTGTRIRRQSEFQNRLPKSQDPNGSNWE